MFPRNLVLICSCFCWSCRSRRKVGIQSEAKVRSPRDVCDVGATSSAAFDLVPHRVRPARPPPRGLLAPHRRSQHLPPHAQQPRGPRRRRLRRRVPPKQQCH